MMTQVKSQGVSQLTLQQKLRKLGQPQSVYRDLLLESEDYQRWVESLLDTVLTKGYLPA